MEADKSWIVTIEIGEHDGHTRAVARLPARDAERSGAGHLTGVGFARLNPADRDVPEIGDEIAVARALSDLARRLLGTATDDLEQVSGEPAHLVM